MKKFYLLFSLAGVATMLSAQELSQEKLQCSLSGDMVPVEVRNSVFSANRVSAKAPLANYSVYVVNSDGVLNRGLSNEFTTSVDSYSYGPIGKYACFKNHTEQVDGATYTWQFTYDKENYFPMNASADGSEASVMLVQAMYFPEATIEKDGSSMTYRKSDFGVDASGNDKTINTYLFPAAQRQLLSMCDPTFCSLFYGPVTLSKEDPTIYFFGDGFENAEGKKMRYALQMFQKATSDVVIYGGNMAFTPVDEKVGVVKGQQIRIEFWSVGSEGNLVEKLGESSISTDGLKFLSESNVWSGSFECKKDDGGITVFEPIIIPAGTRYAARIDYAGTGLCSIVNSANGFNGYSYFEYEDETRGTIGYTNNTSIPMFNITLTLDATLPSAIWYSGTMEIPAGGGKAFIEDEGEKLEYNDVYTYDTFDGEQNIYYECPDWVNDVTFEEVVVNTSDGQMGWEASLAYRFSCTASTLPAGTKGRQGFVEIYSVETDKVIAKMEIGQGEWTPSGVESVEVAKANVAVVGDNFQLTYGEEFNKVTVYNVAGSVVASYALPQGGSFEVPAADLNGVYVLVFEGASNEVVKVVK